ncbi:MAG: 2-C-methyl-D-erythritol 2,4-cyclodiphosphate synthase [Spirochaetia bacterium]|nr:2-C-methyl-D-erythritol 2,4-cyclodiphosphate synthase [Spirochaetia bacterium]
MKLRIGQGFDIHKTKAGDTVILGGVKIPAEFSLEGHSDADVLLHAVTDSLLGAVSENDIGYHFPPGKIENKNRESKDFLLFAYNKIKAMGYRILNIDTNIICEKPQITPYKEKICQNIASLLNLEISQVSVKATTSEKLGFTGREEGIVSTAIVLLSA